MLTLGLNDINLVSLCSQFCSDQMSKSSFGFDFHPPCLDLCRIAQEILSGRITKNCRETLKVALDEDPDMDAVEKVPEAEWVSEAEGEQWDEEWEWDDAEGNSSQKW